jgi:hypothetical protein
MSGIDFKIKFTILMIGLSTGIIIYKNFDGLFKDKSDIFALILMIVAWGVILFS